MGMLQGYINHRIIYGRKGNIKAMVSDNPFKTNTLSQLLFALLTVALTTSVYAEDDDQLQKEFINPSGTSFSNVVTVSKNGVKTIYVSGQVGFFEGKLPQGFSGQVDNVFKNLAFQLEAVGASLSDIVKTNVYIVGLDAEKLKAFNAVRAKHLIGEGLPASTLLGIQALVFPGLQIEIEAVAVIDE